MSDVTFEGNPIRRIGPPKPGELFVIECDAILSLAQMERMQEYWKLAWNKAGVPNAPAMIVLGKELKLSVAKLSVTESPPP